VLGQVRILLTGYLEHLKLFAYFIL